MLLLLNPQTLAKVFLKDYNNASLRLVARAVATAIFIISN